MMMMINKMVITLDLVMQIKLVNIGRFLEHMFTYV